MLRRQERRKEKQKKVLMGIFLTVIMVMSGFGIYLSGSGSASANIADYGVRFRVDQEHGGYQTEFGGNDQLFSYLPSSLDYLGTSPDFTDLLSGAQTIIISSNTSASPSNLQYFDAFKYDMIMSLQTPIASGITQASPEFQLPILTCENATQTTPVIIITEGNTTNTNLQGYCLIAQGDQGGIVELRDWLIYTYYGVYRAAP